MDRLGLVVEEGQQAPDFELATDTGERVRLSDFRGSPVVLFFYPKDDTPGCTIEACSFRDAYAEFQERGAVVLGISPDGVASHGKFRDKYCAHRSALVRPRARGGEGVRRLAREDDVRQDRLRASTARPS